MVSWLVLIGLVGWLVCWLLDWFGCVGWLVGWLIDWLVVWLVDWLVWGTHPRLVIPIYIKGKYDY